MGGAVLGLMMGWFFGPGMNSVAWVGELFLNALRFLVLPLVISALVVGVTGLGDVRKLGRFGSLTLVYFMTTTAIAVLIGIILVLVIRPGEGILMAEMNIPQRILEKSAYTFKDFVLSFLGGGADHKANFFYSLTHMEMLPIVLFSLIFGAILTTCGESGQSVIKLFNGCYDVVMKMIHGIIWFAPIGVFGLVASKIGGVGGADAIVAELSKVGKYCGTVLLGLFVHGFIILPSILIVFGKKDPFGFLAGVRESLLTAFSTASSAATLPITTRNVIENNRISERTANFVLPIGATINMDGTALYEGVAVIFIAQALGVPLAVHQVILIFIMATLAAVAAAAVPEAGLVTMVIILQAVHLPIEGIGLLLAVDWFLDRCRTTVNVWGDSVGTAVMERVHRSTSRVKLEAI